MPLDVQLILCFSPRNTCPYSEFFCSILPESGLNTEMGKCPYLDQMRENTDQKNSEYEHLSRIVFFSKT